MRSGPDDTSKQTGSLSRGTKVYVTAFAHKWCRCSLPGGEHGWIAEWLLEFSADKGRELAASAEPSTPSSSSYHKGNPPAWIDVSAANVRNAPGLGGDSYGTLSLGTKVYVVGRQGGWTKCKTPGGCGWVRGDLLEYNIAAGRKLSADNHDTAAASAPAKSHHAHGIAKAYVTADKAVLRSGPGSRFDEKCVLIKGQTLSISAKHGQWRKVTVHGGASGWIAAWLTKTDMGNSSDSAAGPAPAVARTKQSLPAWVTEKTALVHARPSTEAPVKFKLEQGAKVTVAAVSGHWCKMRTACGNYGWIAGWVIKFVPPGHAITATEDGEKVEVHVGWVARPTVNLRSGPSTDASQVGSESLSTRLIIIGKQGDWYKVALEDGSTGWMACRYIDTRAERIVRKEQAAAQSDQGVQLARVELSPPNHGPFPSPTVTSSDSASASASGSSSGSGSGSGSGSSGNSSVGASLVSIAKQYVGCDYVSGGCSPSGFDCSGFVSYVYHKLHIDVSHSSRELFREGSPVARDDLQPGDVVFFKNTYRSGISHVGIYIGDGKFIHASNHRGGVKITALDSDYYADRYVGARRMY